MSSARALGRRLLVVVFTLALLLAIAGLGQLPYGSESDIAVLRLSLRTVEGQIEICRDRTPEELAALPQHMRTPSQCDDYTPRYRLSLELDDAPILDVEVAPGGWRGDRPLTFDGQVEVSPGPRRLAVRFVPLMEAGLSAAQGAALAELPHYELEDEFLFAANRIALVTLDDGNGRLVVLGD